MKNFAVLMVTVALFVLVAPLRMADAQVPREVQSTR